MPKIKHWTIRNRPTPEHPNGVNYVYGFMPGSSGRNFVCTEEGCDWGPWEADEEWVESKECRRCKAGMTRGQFRERAPYGSLQKKTKKGD